MNDQLKELLKYWGWKSNIYNSTGLGYPPESIEYKLMREAAGASMSGRNINMIIEDSQYDEINSAILGLQPPFSTVIVIHYARPDIHIPWNSDIFPLSRRTFFNYLSAAHNRLGFLV